MIDMADIKQVFTSKLQETGSLDAALMKAAWVAYNSDRPEGWVRLKAPAESEPS